MGAGGRRPAGGAPLGLTFEEADDSVQVLEDVQGQHALSHLGVLDGRLQPQSHVAKVQLQLVGAVHTANTVYMY